MKILELQHLSKQFATQKAVDDISFEIGQGSVFGLLGPNGAGKTTLAGKLALHLREQGHTPLLVAADLQRPNAVDQLTVVGGQAGVPVHAPEPGNGKGDPVAVARSGITFAQAKLHDVVIVDTAGRLAIDADLMRELKNVRQAVTPDEVLLVIDAMTALVEGMRGRFGPNEATIAEALSQIQLVYVQMHEQLGA